MFNNERNNMNEPFKIDMYFNIRYYAKKHSKTITRRAKWDEKCRTWIDKKGNTKVTCPLHCSGFFAPKIK